MRGSNACSIVVAALAAAAAAAPAACRVSRTFACEVDGDCRGLASGRCEPNGWCSTMSDSCTSGRAYDPLAGDGLAGTCVASGDAGSGSGCIAAIDGGAAHVCALRSGGIQHGERVGGKFVRCVRCVDDRTLAAVARIERDRAKRLRQHGAYERPQRTRRGSARNQQQIGARTLDVVGQLDAGVARDRHQCPRIRAAICARACASAAGSCVQRLVLATSLVTSASTNASCPRSWRSSMYS